MNKQEIITLLSQGTLIHWKNEAYKVVCRQGKLFTIFKYNQSMWGLQEAELIHCYVGATNEI